MIDRNLIDKVAWICIKDKKLLGVRSHGKDVYYLPGGKRKEGESDHKDLLNSAL